MIRFYGEELTPRPTPKLEDHPLSAIRDCLFNIFAAALHDGGRSSLRNLRMRYAMLTGTHLLGPKRDEVTAEWRKLHSEELNNLYSSPNIVRLIKKRRMRWAGNVACYGGGQSYVQGFGG
jgi:hypothetical protein